MTIWKEFEDFAVKGNAIDLAVGLVIGAGFGKIVTSLVNDIIMPPFGLLLGKVNFADLFINLSNKHYDTLVAAQAAAAPTINYGAFINTVVNFAIVAFVIFLFVKQINKLRTPPPTETKICEYCLTKIPIKAIRCPACTSHMFL